MVYQIHNIAAAATAHYLYIRSYDGKMSTKASRQPVRMTPHNHTHINTSNVLSLRERSVFEHPYTKLSLSLCLAVCARVSPAIYFRTSNRVEKRPCTWVKDKQRVYVCESTTHATHTLHSHFSNKNKTIEHMFDVATRAHQMSIEYCSPRAFHCWYVKVRNSFMRREK